jgi:hypothetical protein
MIPDIEESGDTGEKRRGDVKLGTTCTDLCDKMELDILKEIHDSPIGKHAVINRKYRKLKQFINWQGMKSDVEKYIR